MITSGTLLGRLLLRVNLSLLLAPEANIANNRKEEQDTVTKLITCSRRHPKFNHSPQSNAKSPNGLCLQTDSLRRSYPRAEIDLPSDARLNAG